MKQAACLLAGLLWTLSAGAELHTQHIEYKDGDTVLKGYLAYDAASKTKRPGIVVVHEWWGLNDYAKHRADMLAQLGYVAFAVDMYGDGRVATTPEEAGKLAGAVKGDRQLMCARVTAGLDVLRKHPLCDAKRIAAIGYCFGGTTVLELARSGADMAGVVSFHGGLDTPNPAEPGKIKCKVLVCAGADDPYVPAAQVAAFEDEMRIAGADWQLISYSGAVHSFTNPNSGNDPSKGVAYNERADKRSWEAMKQFFAEIFK
jgi:dienelactone hydrolase